MKLWKMYFKAFTKVELKAEEGIFYLLVCFASLDGITNYLVTLQKCKEDSREYKENSEDRNNLSFDAKKRRMDEVMIFVTDK